MTVDGTEVGGQKAERKTLKEHVRGIESILRRPATQQHVGRSAGLFLITGIGFGLSGLLVAGLSGVSGINSFAAQTALGFAVLLLPLVAVLTGTLTGLTLRAEREAVLLAAGIGAAFGTSVAVLVVYILAVLAGFGDVGATLSVGALVGLSLGTTVTATLAALVSSLVP